MAHLLTLVGSPTFQPVKVLIANADERGTTLRLQLEQHFCSIQVPSSQLPAGEEGDAKSINSNADGEGGSTLSLHLVRHLLFHSWTTKLLL